MTVTIFNIKRMQGGHLRFSLKFLDSNGMPVIKIHGWRLMLDDSLISPSTYWGGRNNAMSEIPTWEVQSIIIQQVREAELKGEVQESTPKKKKKYKLPKKASFNLDEVKYRKQGVLGEPGSLVSAGDLCCRCDWLGESWIYVQGCPCHVKPESLDD